MATFEPPEPPFVPDGPTPPPTLDTPLPPPEVGFGSPWAPADAENRDRILDWWRMWFKAVFFPWIAAFIAYWDTQWQRLADYINTWMAAADEYITLHAVNGHSWWKTATAIAPAGTTTVALPFDQYRPILVGDLVSDSSPAVRWGQVTALVDDTHAVVTYVGDLRGLTGHSWWTTVTTIAGAGTTDVIIDTDVDRIPVVGDLVSDQSTLTRYGKITVVTDTTHVTVTYIGQLQGPQGIQGDPGPASTVPGPAGLSWWTTTTAIAHAGTTPVVLPTVAGHTPQVGDLVVNSSTTEAYGTITVVTDTTHATVAYIGTLQGPQGPQGVPGVAAVDAFDVTTGALAPGAAYQAQMAALPQMVAAYYLTTSNPAWVRIYASRAYMLADAARDILTPLNIANYHGCYYDFVSNAGELAKTMTPGVMLADLGTGVWLSIKNPSLTLTYTVALHIDDRIIKA